MQKPWQRHSTLLCHDAVLSLICSSDASSRIGLQQQISFWSCWKWGNKQTVSQRNSEKIHSLISDHVARAQLLGRSQLKKWVQNFWNHLDTRGASVPTWLVITYLHRKNVSTESTLVSVGYCELLMCVHQNVGIRQHGRSLLINLHLFDRNRQTRLKSPVYSDLIVGYSP